MEKEKVEEIKLALKIAIKTGERMKKDTYFGPVKVSEILEYINELESENERLSKQLPQFAERLKEKAIRRQEFIGELAIDDIEYVKTQDIDETLKEFLKGKVQNYE